MVSVILFESEMWYFIRDNIKGGALTETTLLILLAVFQPNHGYGIMQYIMQETHGRVKLGAGTLYGAIDALAQKKWITLLEDEGYTRKKEYIITDTGKQIVEKEINRLNDVMELAMRIIREENRDE